MSRSRRRPKECCTELQEQVGISEEAGAQQAMNENGHKIFEIFRQREEDVRIASRAGGTRS